MTVRRAADSGPTRRNFSLMMIELHFKDNFWNTEITCTGGYDAIVQHLNDGRRTCKELEDFMKARASVEEKYAKDLQSLSKKVCGHNEMNTLKRSLDVFKLQIENISLSHLQLAQTIREEAKKLEDFREKQKEMRKKVEQRMDALHKQKALQYKKTMESKKTYEHKCREKEEAEQTMNRSVNTSNTKQQEKLYAKAQLAKQTAEEADRMYSNNVSIFSKSREDWLKEHIKACEVFEQQEVERINTLRNVVWTHLNQLSQQCVTSDELYEEVRRSLECCDIKEDIEHFVNLRRTGNKPPAPVPYENFYNTQRALGTASVAPQAARRGPLPAPEGEVLYSTIAEPEYSIIRS
ncbi:proline-serine-threonine phosphatase-interacting protein 2 [Scleropages formosus]|uniref:Proline-serine-threonine phosphatase interacting protein 2 n=1 Tax=Scleropages formosus TaxID=113540 RepID=A0A8C9WSP9_SCLFO|nr:proline-serine-threonine phosphatase-interacting protein 2 [Scleropages formosus]